MTAGPIERAIRANVRSGATLTTPARGAPFTVATIDGRGVVLLLGAQEAQTRFTWHALEGVWDLLAGGGWLTIGTSFTSSATPGTLDAYLKLHVRRATAGWVAALLEAAGVVQIDRRPPARIRLASAQR
jgi:hypothetical protein